MARYGVYEFNSRITLRNVLINQGFTVNGNPPTANFPTECTFEKDGESLVVHYSGKIITNYPVTYDEEGNIDWEPIESTKIYLISARTREVRLPPPLQVTGSLRRYYHKYIAKFMGERVPTE